MSYLAFSEKVCQSVIDGQKLLLKKSYYNLFMTYVRYVPYFPLDANANFTCSSINSSSCLDVKIHRCSTVTPKNKIKIILRNLKVNKTVIWLMCTNNTLTYKWIDWHWLTHFRKHFIFRSLSLNKRQKQAYF